MEENNIQLEPEVLPEVQWQSSPEDWWCLDNLPRKDLEIIYPDKTWEGLRRTRSKLRKLAKQGKLHIMPSNPEYENPETERERANARRKRVAPKMGEGLIQLAIPEEHKYYHEQLQKALEEEGHLSKARFSDYQMGMKNADGEFESHDLRAARFEVKFEKEPQWFPITPVTLEKPLKRTYEKAKNPTDWQTTVVIPDIQMPCHDEKALSVLLNICKTLKPDNFVQLGDMLDLTAHGRFTNSNGAEFANSTDQALRQALGFLRELRTISPHARIVYMEGNHEQRVPRDILNNHQHNHGIRPADDPEGYPLVSVPRMVGLSAVDAEYMAGYPDNRFWINDNLQIIHGNITGRNENKRTLMSEKVSTIYGHSHRLGVERQTVNFRDGALVRKAWNAGTLSRTDKYVPGYHTGYGLDGNPVSQSHENWQQGFLVVTHNDQSFFIEEVEINQFSDYQTLFRGKVYTP